MVSSLVESVTGPYITLDIGLQKKENVLEKTLFVSMFALLRSTTPKCLIACCSANFMNESVAAMGGSASGLSL